MADRSACRTFLETKPDQIVIGHCIDDSSKSVVINKWLVVLHVGIKNSSVERAGRISLFIACVVKIGRVLPGILV